MLAIQGNITKNQHLPNVGLMLAIQVNLRMTNIIPTLDHHCAKLAQRWLNVDHFYKIKRATVGPTLGEPLRWANVGPTFTLGQRKADEQNDIDPTLTTNVGPT